MLDALAQIPRRPPDVPDPFRFTDQERGPRRRVAAGSARTASSYTSGSAAIVKRYTERCVTGTRNGSPSSSGAEAQDVYGQLPLPKFRAGCLQANVDGSPVIHFGPRVNT
jgi:hypothetical protein